MPAVDPTYPLYPIACILASALLLLTLATSFARQSWNLGVTFLCFWLFWENLTSGIDAIVWSDNYDLKLYVYCDIVIRLQVITAIVKPMCTLIITRRLYLIASLRSVELPSSREKRNNDIIEWTLGLIVPLVIAGPLYYIVQHPRFEVTEGFGCNNSADGSVLTDLLLTMWIVVPPLVSIGFYYPKVIGVFYRQHRDTNRFLRSNNSISRTNYFRIMALASIDILFTLPTSVFTLVIKEVQINRVLKSQYPFYSGWTNVHSQWAPVGIPYAELILVGREIYVQQYVTIWTAPLLAFIVFGLFGLTAEARATYLGVICFVGKWFGWKPASRNAAERPALGTMEFGARPQDISLDAELGSRPSFVNFERAVVSGAASAEGAEQGEHASDALVGNDLSGSVAPAEDRAERATLSTPSREQNQV